MKCRATLRFENETAVENRLDTHGFFLTRTRLVQQSEKQFPNVLVFNGLSYHRLDCCLGRVCNIVVDRLARFIATTVPDLHRLAQLVN